MEADPVAEILAQLRDLHVPENPSIWPLPLGWWISFLLLLVLAVICVWVYLQIRKKLLPYSVIRSSAHSLNRKRNSGKLAPLDYATRINLLYKEVLVRIEGHTEATELHGNEWLEYLAERFSNTEFVHGSGKCLGATRFLPGNYSDEGLQELVEQTLLRAGPRSKLRDV